MSSPNPNRLRLGLLVTRARTRLGMKNQPDLAKAAHIGVGVVGAIERGDRKVAERSLTAVEAALAPAGWQLGDCAAVLRGEIPPHLAYLLEQPASEPGHEPSSTSDDELKAALEQLWRSTTPERFWARVSEIAGEAAREAEQANVSAEPRRAAPDA